MPEAFTNKKALLLSLRDNKRVSDIIPGTKELQDGRLAVKHDQTHYELLQALNVKVDGFEPIRFYYDAPKLRGEHAPMNHQKETYAFMTAHKRMFILNEMALGKTASALWACDYLIRVAHVKKVLIICTLSTTKDTWQNEIFSIFPNRTSIILRGGAERAAELAKIDVDFYIINHDGVRVREKLLKKLGVDLIVVDEGSKYKHAGSERYKSLERIITKEMRVLWMTGTPTSNGPEDAWAQCRIVNPKKVPHFFNAWRDKVMLKVNMFKWVAREGWKNIVYDAMQPAIRFKKSDVLDLPPVIPSFRYAPLTESQTKMAAQLEQNAAVSFQGHVLTAANGGVLAMKLRQIFCGTVRSVEGEQITLEYGPRIDELKAIIEEAQSKVIIFVPFTFALQRVNADLLEAGFTTGVIDGSVKGKNRESVLSAFTGHTDPHLLICNPETAAHGLNLIAADTIVWFAPNDKTEIYIQANERINRPGQKLSMRIVHLYGSPIEKKRYEGLQSNQTEAEMLLGMYRDMFGDQFNFQKARE